ncbi:hypothetical protein [Oerskovia sp. Root22]|uniref:hypothetical protein n=1 Tax=Oerskovia sp. Root22 TaxID=1736494 RepID=UPI0006F57420|nr:hypothetical protein [Oerskovia sp. Root22]KRC37532.1 hypothetical protein ASE15_05305 [Oerskovia sp. Root22]
MVRASLWLDRKRDTTDGLAPRDTTVTGKFVEDSGFGVARVQIPHDGPENLVNVPASPGVYAPGAIVTVTLSTRGVPLGVTPPLHLPADVAPVGVGDEGKQTLVDRHALLEGVEWQLQAAGKIEGLDERLEGATDRLDNIGAEVIDSGQTLAQRLAAAYQVGSDAAGVAADAAAAAAAADGKASGALTAAQQAAGAASSAQTKADQATTAAGTAAQAAADAAGLAGGKADVLIQASAPSVAMRKVTTLWIDTTGGTNTPKRWTTGTTWVAVTDKAATDAAAAAATAASAAATAQARADAAHALAGTAEANAQLAIASANGKTMNSRSTAVPAGNGKVPGDTWWQFADATFSLVIGQWTWSGGAWQKMGLSHQVISSVDVGSLVVVGTATLAQAVIDKLWADVVRAYKITTDMLLVGSGANLLVDPFFTTRAAWTNSAFVQATGGRLSGGCLLIPMSATQSGAYNSSNTATLQYATPVEEGKKYRVGGWVLFEGAAPTGSGRASLYARFYNPATGAFEGATLVVSNPAGVAADTWTWVEGVITAPAGRTHMSVGAYKQTTHTVGPVRWDGLVVNNMTDASLMVDGGILARHITASEELWAKIATFAQVTAGMIVLGQDARLTPEGLTLYGPAEAGQDPTDWANRTPMLQLTSSGARTVAVGNTAGEVTAALTPDGQIVGRALAVSGQAEVGSLTVGGATLDEAIDLRGARIVSRFDAAGTGGTIAAGAWYQVAEMSFTNPFDYPLQLVMEGTSLEVYLSSAGTAEAKWYASANGAAPVVGQSYHFGGTKGSTSAAGSVTLGLPPLVVVLNPGVTWRVRPSLMGTVAWNVPTIHTTRFVCLSLGRAQENLGGQFTALSPPYVVTPVVPPAAKKRYMTGYDPIAVRTFTEAGAAANSTYVNELWQGYTPYSSPQGNAMKSMAAYNSWTGDLAGADIERIEILLSVGHTYNAAGVTLQLGFHGVTSAGTWSRYGGIVPVFMNRGQQDKWITLDPSLHAQFKSGLVRGLVFDPAGNRDKNLYARITRAWVRITYVK